MIHDMIHDLMSLHSIDRGKGKALVAQIRAAGQVESEDFFQISERTSQWSCVVLKAVRFPSGKEMFVLYNLNLEERLTVGSVI